MKVRFRTCGDMPITGAVESDAEDLDTIFAEVAASRTTERVGVKMINVLKQQWKTEESGVFLMNF
jgi:3'-phosphoadenosine 5'-phosphosulfate sulfotransferase (PAPS reductase)/FAD synthetase